MKGNSFKTTLNYRNVLAIKQRRNKQEAGLLQAAAIINNANNFTINILSNLNVLLLLAH